MANGIVQVPPDSVGKCIDTSELIIGALTVERQRIVIADANDATAFAEVSSNGALIVDGSTAVQPVSGSVTVLNLPATQSVSGSVAISNLPTSQNVHGTVAITNYPATQSVSGTVNIANFPSSQHVIVDNPAASISISNFPATQPVSGSVAVSNLPANQTVSGVVSINNFPASQHVSVDNYPATQTISGSVNVANFPPMWPGVQPVSGTVNVANFPPSQHVTVDNQLSTIAVSNFPAPISSIAVSNFPVTQPVSGTVSVSNLPVTQSVSGTVGVNNFPAIQDVTGSVAAKISDTDANPLTSTAGALDVNIKSGGEWLAFTAGGDLGGTRTAQTVVGMQGKVLDASIGAPLDRQVITYDSVSATYKALSLPAAIPQINSDWDATSGVAEILNKPALAKVATSGSYTDLTSQPTIPAAQINSDWNVSSGVAQILNKPTIPAAQINSDWNASSGVAQILNKPALAKVATSGSYTDLTGQPTIPAAQVNSDWNASSGVAHILNQPSLAVVAISGSYTDLTSKPFIPPAQVNSDWDASSGVAEILNKPTIPSAFVAAGDLSGSDSSQQVVGLQKVPLDAATVGTPTNGWVITYDSATGHYKAIAPTTSIYTAGAGISIVSDVITNTEPNVQSDWNATLGLPVILNKPILATVATSGSYVDLLNKPTIPAAQVNSDWNAASGVAHILNKPPLTYDGVSASTITGDLTVSGMATNSGIGIGQAPLANSVGITNNQNNNSTAFKAINTNTGGSAQVSANFNNGTNSGAFGMVGTGYNSYGSTIPADSFYFYNGGTGGMEFINAGTVPRPISFVVNGSAATPLQVAQFLNGLTIGAPTGGDKGLGTVNVSGGFYVNGVAVGTGTTQVNSDWTALSGVAQILNKPPLTYDGVSTSTLTSAAVINDAVASSTAGALIINAVAPTTGLIIQGTYNPFKVYSPDASRQFQLGISNTGDPVFWSSTGVLAVSSTSLSLQGSSLFVYSPDKTRDLQISCANGADPTLSSSTANTNLTGTLTINSSSYGLVVHSSSSPFICYSPDGTRSLQVGLANANDPMFYSSTGNLIVTSTNLTINNGSLFVASPDKSQHLQINCTNAGGANAWAGCQITASNGYVVIASEFDTIGATGLNVNSPDLTNYIAMQCPNGAGRPFFLSSTGVIVFYSKDQTRWLEFQMISGADPVLSSSTGTIMVQNQAPTTFTRMTFSSPDAGRLVYLTVTNGVDPSLTSTTNKFIFSTAIDAFGVACRPGYNATRVANNFNINYVGSSAQLWIDTTNMGTIAFTSDYRIKTDIDKFDGAIPLLNQLRPIRFRYRDVENDIFKSDGIQHVGLIAHEVQEVLPGAVFGEKDALTSDGKIQPQGLNWPDLVALLCRAVQELSLQFEEFKAARC